MSGFERYAIQRLVDQANAAGIEVPKAVSALVSGACRSGSYAAQKWTELHPGNDTICCYGSVNGPDGCTCWRPVYELEQAPPCPPADPGDIQVQRRMCGDCAFRKGSPERADRWSEDALFDLARSETPFWCHQDMRRPVRWVHPDGRVVDGSPDDWQPPMVAGIPYRADGSPGLLCAGWMAHAARAREAADGQ